jgi:RNA polymerase-binding transcription factor DksA
MHLGDLGTEVYMQELNATLLENQDYIAREVDAALGRVEAGTYGDCESCGVAILEERLELLPYTRYCTPCAEQVQDGHVANLDAGRPRSGADTIDPHDDEDDDRDERAQVGEPSLMVDREDELLVEHDDVHAVGTPGGGTAVGGLAGTNVGEGDPVDVDLEEAMGSGHFDQELEAEQGDDATAYSGPAGGAVGGTPAGKRTTGGTTGGGIAPRPDPGDSPTGD